MDPVIIGCDGRAGDRGARETRYRSRRVIGAGEGLARHGGDGRSGCCHGYAADRRHAAALIRRAGGAGRNRGGCDLASGASAALAAGRDEALAARGRNRASWARRALLGALPLGLAGTAARASRGPLSVLGDAGAVRFADCSRGSRPGRAALEAAVARLRGDGTAFQLESCRADGRLTWRRRRSRRRSEGWPSDSSAADGSRSAADRRARPARPASPGSARHARRLAAAGLAARTRDLKLVDCNRAYAAAVDAAGEQGAGRRPRDRRRRRRRQRPRARAPRARSAAPSRRAINRHRRLAPADGVHRGAARRHRRARGLCPRLHRPRERPGRARAPHRRACRRAGECGGGDRHLRARHAAHLLSTPPLPQLWRLEEDWLVTEPTLDEVLERLRERRRIARIRRFPRLQAPAARRCSPR